MDLYKIQQQFPHAPAVDAYAACRESLRTSGILLPVQKGQQVCLALPSRGISALPVLARACVDALQECGASVFIVPAMGSHGGGTAEGQKAVLASYGIDQAHLGVLVRSCLDTIVLGQAEMESGEKVTVYWDAWAAKADHVLAVNRIKEHTAFSGEHESGLMKILSVGLGKARGAKEIHARGLAQAMPAAARYILNAMPVLGGVAVVENAQHQPAMIEALPGAILPRREAELLALSRNLLPRIPVNDLDVLVVRRMGKDISGTGMDTNVIGKYRRNWGIPEPAFDRIVVLDLTDASHGNAAGVGFADVITRRLYEKIDYEATLLNCLTAGNFNGAKIPVIRENDREVILCAMAGMDAGTMRLAIVDSTLDLDTIWVSETVREDLREKPNVILTESRVNFDQCFDAEGVFSIHCI